MCAQLHTSCPNYNNWKHRIQFPYIYSPRWCYIEFKQEQWLSHYDDVIMGAMASQITSLTIVYSIVYSGTDQRKNIKAPRHWPLYGEFTGDRWIPRTNGQLRGKCFHLMTSSCSLAVGRSGGNVRNVISEHMYGVISWALLVKLLSGECHRTPLMITQHWFG